MVAEKKVLIEHAPLPSVTGQQVLAHFQTIKSSLTLPYQRMGAIALEKDLAQAVPFVLHAISLASLGLMKVGISLCQDLPDGIQTAYSIQVDRFVTYLETNRNREFATFGEPWPALLFRLFMAFREGNDSYLLPDTTADFVQRVAHEFANSLTSWVEPDEFDKNYALLKPRLNDSRRTGKLLKEFAPPLSKVIELLPDCTPDEIYAAVAPGTDVILHWHLDRLCSRLKYAFGNNAFYRQRTMDRDIVFRLVGQILVWNVCEEANASLAAMSKLAAILKLPCPGSDPWLELFEYSEYGKQHIDYLTDGKKQWKPQ